MRKTASQLAGSSAILGLALMITMTSPTWAGREEVKRARSWSYQLTGDLSSTKRSNSDIAVLDPDLAGDASKYRTKPNGGSRQVIAYISIGEAEVGRAYMKGSSQSWNTGITQGWAGNYATRFWQPEWKAIVKSRVRQALGKGYDGIFLDRVDTYERVKPPSGSARQEMINFVKEVAAEARSAKSGAVVLVQNGEELLNDKSYVAAIDGMAKEDLYHGIQHRGERNSSSDVNWSRSYLKNFKAQGKAVLVVEYLSGSTADKVADEARRDGFIPYTKAPRNLQHVID